MHAVDVSVDVSSAYSSLRFQRLIVSGPIQMSITWPFGCSLTLFLMDVSVMQ